jgi:hypothetical protein
LLVLVLTSLLSLSITVAVSVAIAVSVIPFLVDCCTSPTAIAVNAVVFVTLLLPSGNGYGNNTCQGNGNEVAGN